MELEDLHAVQCDDPEEIAQMFRDIDAEIATFALYAEYPASVRPAGEGLH